jgi:hypothetical protein
MDKCYWRIENFQCAHYRDRYTVVTTQSDQRRIGLKYLSCGQLCTTVVLFVIRYIQGKLRKVLGPFLGGSVNSPVILF